MLEENPGGAVLLDCVSNMVTNLMLDAEPDYDALSQARVEEIERDVTVEFDRLMDTLHRQGRRAVIVTNEVGLGVDRPIPAGPGVRRYIRAGQSRGWPPAATRCICLPVACRCGSSEAAREDNGCRMKIFGGYEHGLQTPLTPFATISGRSSSARTVSSITC